ncbi:DUF4145 domain-containing protein [Paenibacillus sp. FSL H7-0690]|uniref:DUF4145 domain-containing protein n=1 Tax=Paenibacillus sp. FSL H7-0690 TaxID=2921437 RepID=UPI0030EB1ED4
MEILSEKLYCKRCKRHTNHKVLSNDNIPLSYTISASGFDDYNFHDEYHIVQCMGCDNVCFANVYSGDDCQEVDEDGYLFYDTVYTVYPEEPKPVAIKRIFYQVSNFTNVPSFINQVYHEVVSSFNTEANLLPAVGLRTIVEAICKEVKVIDGFVYKEDGTQVVNKEGNPLRSDNLQGKINGLHEMGIITLPQRNILHQIRLLGNYAVHEIEFPKRKTIRLGIEIIEKTLENIYELDKYDLNIK